MSLDLIGQFHNWWITSSDEARRGRLHVLFSRWHPVANLGKRAAVYFAVSPWKLLLGSWSGANPACTLQSSWVKRRGRCNAFLGVCHSEWLSMGHVNTKGNGRSDIEWWNRWWIRREGATTGTLQTVLLGPPRDVPKQVSSEYNTPPSPPSDSNFSRLDWLSSVQHLDFEWVLAGVAMPAARQV